MPSIVKEYEYDIFISYRHKDNRYEGWVTEFVNNLKKELGVTFKEEISVYFDENPYDGILEGHEVNDSLSSKLKCLIFIPIISQTYCDPKSYAWNNEFLVFKELATQDAFGLKIKLSNGNVASRIIPVRIHEPDAHDSILLLNELGGTLRSIDFIFRSPGVNRPLQAHEDHPRDNKNKTYYRDQVNKVANLIKEILDAIKPKEAQERPPRTSRFREVIARPSKWRRATKVFLIFILLATSSLIYYFSTYNYTDLQPVSNRATIAIIPFKVIGNEAEGRYFADGVQEDIRSKLCMFSELKVKSRTSVEQYRNSPKSVTEIGSELNVLYVLEGSAQKYGDHIRLMVQLIDARSDVNLWSERFEQKFENVFEIQSQISEKIARLLKATLTPNISKRIKQTPTRNFEVYDLFLRAKQTASEFSQSGDQEAFRVAISLLKETVTRDTTFALGYAWLAGLKMYELQSFNNNLMVDSILLLADKALRLDSTVVEAQMALSHLYYLGNDDVNTLRYTYAALENPSIDDGSVMDLIKRLASIYTRIGDIKPALYLLNQILTMDPQDTDALEYKFYCLASDHQLEDLKEMADYLEASNPNHPLVPILRTHISLERRDADALKKTYDKYFRSPGGTELPGQYALMYAYVLRESGDSEEANIIAEQMGFEFENDNFFLGQLRLFEGNAEAGLSLLQAEEVGWYNLSLCSISPLFTGLMNNPKFMTFKQRNESRIINNRDRIHQLEKEGFLRRAEEFLKSERVEFEL